LGKGQTAKRLLVVCCLPFPRSRRPLRAWRSLRLRHAFTYGNRRLWITFWREFWGVFWGGFLEPIGPGAGVRADFSAEGVLLVRWASANFDFFRGFFLFLDRFLPVFVPYFALFPSMPCAYLYVSNFFPVSLAWDLHTSNRKVRKARKGRTRGTRLRPGWGFRLRPDESGLRRDRMPRQAGSAKACRRRPADAGRETPCGPLATGQRLAHRWASPEIGAGKWSLHPSRPIRRWLYSGANSRHQPNR